MWMENPDVPKYIPEFLFASARKKKPTHTDKTLTLLIARRKSNFPELVAMQWRSFQ